MGTSGTNEDDLTVKLADIIYINRFIADMCSKGATSSVIFENWDFLQQQVIDGLTLPFGFVVILIDLI